MSSKEFGVNSTKFKESLIKKDFNKCDELMTEMHRIVDDMEAKTDEELLMKTGLAREINLFGFQLLEERDS